MNGKQTAKLARDLLVIGYGNTLRRDDGVGPKVVEAIAAMNLPRVKALVCHQLTPELAETISQSQRAIFVDAALDAKDGVELREIQPADASQILAHATDPRSLLTLSRQLYGRNPQAWSLAIPVEDLGFGDGLSPRAEAGFRSAVKRIRKFVDGMTQS